MPRCLILDRCRRNARSCSRCARPLMVTISLVSHDIGPDQRSWDLGRASWIPQFWVFTIFTGGDGSGYWPMGTHIDPVFTPTGGDETSPFRWIRTTVLGNGASSPIGTTPGGCRLEERGSQHSRRCLDSNAVLQIGSHYGNPGASVWAGRVYYVELRTGLDPAGGSVVWRFDAANPIGWTLTDEDAIVANTADPMEQPVTPMLRCSGSSRRSTTTSSASTCATASGTRRASAATSR